MGYEKDPLAAMEAQIKALAKAGHDIQLHIHPQWVDAKWNGKGWTLNMDEYRLGGYTKEGEFSLEHLLRKGKETLEELIRPICPEYRCVALRAGGYNAQPSGDIVKAMREVGLFFDSSIYPGGYEQALSVYDYRKITREKGLWSVSDQLEYESNVDSRVYELPIVSLNVARWRKYLSCDRFKMVLSNTHSAKEMYETKISQSAMGGKKKSKLEKLTFLFEEECQTWDYCLLPNALQRKFIKEMERQKEREYFTLVGHPKSFLGSRNVEFLLKRLSQKDCCFVTISKEFKHIFE